MQIKQYPKSVNSALAAQESFLRDANGGTNNEHSRLAGSTRALSCTYISSWNIGLSLHVRTAMLDVQ